MLSKSLNRSLFLSLTLFSSSVFGATKGELIAESKRLYERFHEHEGSFEKFADILVKEYNDSPAMTEQNCSIKGQMIFNATYRLNPQTLFGKKNDDGSFENLLTDPEDLKRGLLKLFKFRRDFTKEYAALTAQQGFQGNRGYVRFERCGKMVQVVNRTIRGMEDLYGLRYLELTGKIDPENPDNYYKPNKDGSEFPYTFVTDDYKQAFEQDGLSSFVRSGDVFLVRGDNFTGAIISRIGGNDNQFSHLAIVYEEKDGSVMGPENIGKKYVVESIPDKGLYILPLKEFMDGSKARLVLFRLKHLDKTGKTPTGEIAHIAARYMAQYAETNTIKYNFTMDMSLNDGGIKSVFCSQAWSEGMNFACTQAGIVCEDLASLVNPDRKNPIPNPGKQVSAQYPLIWTEVPVKQNQLVQLLSIEVEESFSPGDVEMDPRLDLVADFKYYPKINSARGYDMIFSKIFQWIENGGYSFNEASPFILSISQSVMAVTDNLNALVDDMDNLPKATPEGIIRAGLYVAALSEFALPSREVLSPIANAFVAMNNNPATLQSFSNKLYGFVSPEDIAMIIERAAYTIEEFAGFEGFNSRIYKLNKAVHKKTGFYLSNRQIDQALEAVRIKACKDYKQVTRACDKKQVHEHRIKCIKGFEKQGKRIRFHRFFAQDFSDTQKACQEDPIKWGIVWQF